MARSFARSPALLQGCLLAFLAGACSDSERQDATPNVAAPNVAGAMDAPGILGGQSGTEGGESHACEPPAQDREVALDEALPELTFTARQLADSLAATPLPGRWLAAERTELSVQLDAAQPVRDVSGATRGGEVCRPALEVSLAVRTSDGAVDAVVRARVEPADFNHVLLDATLPPLPAAVLGPARAADVAAVKQLDLSLGQETPNNQAVALRIALNIGEAMQRAVVYDAGEPRGVWLRDAMGLPWGQPTPFTPDPRFSASCSGADELQADFGHHTSFASSSAALAGVAKVWVRCRDGVPASHSGIQILPDGSWRHVELVAGGLVALYGFGHEGYVRLLDTSVMNGAGAFQLELLPFGRNYDAVLPVISERSTAASDRALVFRPYGASEDWPAAVYQPTALGVLSLAPQYAEGERAGSAACEREEQGLVFDPAQAAPLLSGEFVLCSGSLQGHVARLRFAPDQVELLAEDGGVIARPAFDPASGSVQFEARAWTLTVSRQPLKVLVEERLDYGVSKAVFSAVP